MVSPGHSSKSIAAYVEQSLPTHQSDHCAVLKDLLPRDEAELEHVRQHQLPDGPIENPEYHDRNPDETVEIVRQRWRIANLIGRADERRDEH